jgi:hypothetical protein
MTPLRLVIALLILGATLVGMHAVATVPAQLVLSAPAAPQYVPDGHYRDDGSIPTTSTLTLR